MPRKATDHELTEFALAHLDSCSLSLRAALCRRLAELVIDRDAAATLLAQAESLEEIDTAHNQLLLNLRGGAR